METVQNKVEVKFTIENAKEKCPKYLLKIVYDKDDNVLFGSRYTKGKALVTQYADNITEKVASKNVQINFNTGSAEILPSSYGLLNQIFSEAVSSQGLKVGVYGHTDNTGDPAKNQTLSEARAESVKNWLLKKGLPAEQIESKGYGDQQPIADNETTAGKAKNRRVEIALGQ